MSDPTLEMTTAERIVHEWPTPATHAPDEGRVMLAASMYDAQMALKGEDMPRDWETACAVIATILDRGNSVAVAVQWAISDWPFVETFTVYGYAGDEHPAHNGNRAEHHMTDVESGFATFAEALAFARGWVTAHTDTWHHCLAAARGCWDMPPTYLDGVGQGAWDADEFGETCPQCGDYLQDGDLPCCDD